LLDHASIVDSLAPWNSINAGAEKMPVNDLARLVHQGAGLFESYLEGSRNLQDIFDLQTTCIFEAY